MIWAIGDTDDIGYHGRDTEKRGPQIVNFLDAPTPAADLSQSVSHGLHEALKSDTRLSFPLLDTRFFRSEEITNYFVRIHPIGVLFIGFLTSIQLNTT